MMMQSTHKIAVILLCTGVLSACGKVGGIAPPQGKEPIQHTYPAPSCLDKLKDIKQADTCKNQ